MADAFQAGIGAAQGAQQQQAQRASIMASVYSTLLQTNAAFEAEKMRQTFSLQQKLVEEQGLALRAGIQADATLKATAMKEQGDDRRKALEEQVKYQIAFEDRVTRAATDEFRIMTERQTGLEREHIQGQYNLQGQAIQARTSAMNQLLSQQTDLTKHGLTQGMTPEQAIALGRTAGMDPKDAMQVGRALPNPKGQMDIAKGQADLAKTQAEIQNIGSQMWEREQNVRISGANAETNRMNAITNMVAQGTTGYAKANEGLAVWTNQWLGQGNKNLKNNSEAQQKALSDWNALRQLRDAAASGQIDGEQYAQQSAQIIAQSGISPTVWQEGLLLDSVASANASRAGGALSLVVQSLPTAQLEAFHQQQAPEAKGLVDNVVSAVSFGWAERFGRMSSGAGMSSDDLDNAFSAATGQTTGKPPTQQQWAAWSQKSDWEKRQALAGMVNQSAAAADAVQRFDAFNTTISQVLFGDAARSATGQQGQGDYGLAGDALVVLAGAKAFQVAAPMARGLVGGAWKGAPNLPFVGKAFMSAEKAASKMWGGMESFGVKNLGLKYRQAPMGPYGSPFPDLPPIPKATPQPVQMAPPAFGSTPIGTPTIPAPLFPVGGAPAARMQVGPLPPTPQVTPIPIGGGGAPTPQPLFTPGGFPGGGMPAPAQAPPLFPQPFGRPPAMRGVTP